MTIMFCICLGVLPWHGRALGDGTPMQKTEHPLPKHFIKLDLTTEQQKKICAVMDEYDEEIERHLEQLRKLRGKPFTTSLIIIHASAVKKLRGQRSAALEKVLTAEQQARLKELRATEEPDREP
jgi:Spy/CpxP family protein refolding chaperone